jgi:hypothetical protein
MGKAGEWTGRGNGLAQHGARATMIENGFLV